MTRTFRTAVLLLAALLSLAIGAVAQQPAKPHVAKAAPKSAHVEVRELSFFSASLGREMKYMAILPAGYADSQKRYPVLYLLHGWNGDRTNWVNLTALVEYAQPYSFIIIAPDAGNSWYINSGVSPQERVEDYIIRDLLKEVDGRLRTIASPHRRAVAGLSMGGYGAVLFALKHPDLFAMAGSISGAFDGPSGIESVMPFLQESLLTSYGAVDNPSRAANNVYTLAENSSAKLPYFYLTCGSSDPLLPSSRKLVKILSDRGIAYEYHEYAGVHDWAYWDNSLPLLLENVNKHIAAQ